MNRPYDVFYATENRYKISIIFEYSMSKEVTCSEYFIQLSRYIYSDKNN
jgi:hypothetical protein